MPNGRMTNREFLSRIDERVKSIKEDIKVIHIDIKETKECQNNCRSKTIPKMITQIEMLKTRPIGASATLLTVIRSLFLGR